MYCETAITNEVNTVTMKEGKDEMTRRNEEKAYNFVIQLLRNFRQKVLSFDC